MKWFIKSDLETGLNGKPEKVREKALVDSEYTKKIELVEGCMKAFDEGRPENFRTFLGAYLEFKRKSGSLDKIMTEGMDEGIVNLASRPLMRLIEKSQTPAQTIESLTTGLSPYYRQVALDLALREASGKANSWFVVEAVLAAGADANAGGGRPLASAIRNDNTRIAGILFTHGADFDKVPAFAEAGHATKAAALKEKFAAAAAQKAAAVTPEVPAPTVEKKTLIL